MKKQGHSGAFLSAIELPRTLRCLSWKGPSPRLKRIYIGTSPDTQTYYDICKREWRSDSAVDLVAIRKKVLDRYKARDEEELAELLSNRF